MDNSILSQILSGIKKIPGNALGAPADIGNILINAAKAGYGYVGSKTGLLSADQLPTLEDDPIGGSKQINRQFGLGESKGVVDDLVQIGGGLFTPGNAAAAMKAVILPAALLHDAQTVSAAGKLISAGREDQVYKATKIFQGTEQNAPLKVVLPDSNVGFQSLGSTLRNVSTGDIGISPLARNLGEVIDHPELFAAVPGLAETPVNNMTGRGGSFDTSTGVIKIGEYPTEKALMSTILHETQHKIQNMFGFTGGSNPGYFLRDQATIRKIQNEVPLAPSEKKIIDNTLDKAYQNYANTGGELEAQVVQAQFMSDNYSASPAKLAIQQAGGRENIINDKSKVPKVDDDPAIRGIIDFYNQTP